MTDKIPSGTSASPSSAVSPKAEMVRCLSLRLSELRNGADVFRLLRDFLNMIVAKGLVSILRYVILTEALNVCLGVAGGPLLLIRPLIRIEMTNFRVKKKKFYTGSATPNLKLYFLKTLSRW